MKKLIESFTRGKEGYNNQMTVSLKIAGSELKSALAEMKKYKAEKGNTKYSFFIVSILKNELSMRIWEPTDELLIQLLDDGFELNPNISV